LGACSQGQNGTVGLVRVYAKYDTKQDLDIAVIHSKELIRGLNAFMASLGLPERFSDSGEGLDAKIKSF
jgi:hypothetical protein